MGGKADSFTASDIDSLQQSDMAVIIMNDQQDVIWVNKSKAEALHNTGNVPKNTFPFARLASATTSDNQTTFLYHQMNETTFAEESFQVSMGEWGDTTYINVATLSQSSTTS